MSDEWLYDLFSQYCVLVFVAKDFVRGEVLEPPVQRLNLFASRLFVVERTSRMFSSLSADTVRNIFEYACGAVPVACLVERIEPSSYWEQENPCDYRGGWHTVIVGRMKRWRVWRFDGYKNVLCLPNAGITFHCNRRSFLPLVPYMALLCAESMEGGLHMAMPADRGGTISYVLRDDYLHMRWSPYVGVETDLPLYDLRSMQSIFHYRVPRGYYQHFRELLEGDNRDVAGNRFSHVTTHGNPDTVVACRQVLVPSALIVSSRFCRRSACESVMENVYHIATLPSHLIPRYV